jgi:cytochrome c oxidase subunit III
VSVSTLELPVGPAPADPRVSLRTSLLGMKLALAAIGMLFTAFTSAYVVRHALDPDWHAVPMPRIMVANTLALLISSLSLEVYRRHREERLWLTLSQAMGVLFVAGQVFAWRQLQSQGVYLSNNPHAAFFYVLTAAHGLHILGGLFALGGITVVAQERRFRWLEAASLYWHFMGALWLYLLFLLFGMN